MLNSATLDARRVQRLHEIHAQACRLVLEHGFAGFTMDDLAAAVGCSRRTLFNYVPDKASAVIGVWQTPWQHPAITTYLQGGPTGNLFDDSVSTIRSVIETMANDEIDPAGGQLLLSRAMDADPKVTQLVGERFEQMRRLLGRAIGEREGWASDDRRALALAASLFSLLVVALHEFEGENISGTAPDVPHRLSALFQQAVDAEHVARSHRRPVPIC